MPKYPDVFEDENKKIRIVFGGIELINIYGKDKPLPDLFFSNVMVCEDFKVVCLKTARVLYSSRDYFNKESKHFGQYDTKSKVKFEPVRFTDNKNLFGKVYIDNEFVMIAIISTL